MKKSLYLLVAFTFFLVSCERNDTGPVTCKVATQSDTAVFVGNQPAPIFENCITGLTAAVTAINDSRCPEGAACIWQGTIVVDLQVANQFSIRLQQGIQKDTVYQGRAYSFTLTDITPYPTVNTDPPVNRKTFVRILKR